MTILLHFVCVCGGGVTLDFICDQYIFYLGISLVFLQLPAPFSPVGFSVLYYSFLSFKIGIWEWIYVYLQLIYIVVQAETKKTL